MVSFKGMCSEEQAIGGVLKDQKHFLFWSLGNLLLFGGFRLHHLCNIITPCPNKVDFSLKSTLYVLLYNLLFHVYLCR